MNLNQTINESTLSKLYEGPSFLSPTWRVIFQEAVRGNHILFDSLPGYQKMTRLTLHRVQIQDLASRALEEKFAKVLQSDCFSDIQSVIREMTPQQQSLLFVLYKRVIESWKVRHKNSLN